MTYYPFELQSLEYTEPLLTYPAQKIAKKNCGSQIEGSKSLRAVIQESDLDKVVEDLDSLSSKKKRSYIALRFLCLILTNTEDWDEARKAVVLKKDHGFTDEDDLLEEGDIEQMDTLLEVIEEKNKKIAQKNEEIAKLKASIDAKEKEIEALNKESRALKTETQNLKADRSSPFPA